MRKPWFAPLPPVFPVFPVTWQGWVVTVVGQLLFAVVLVFAPRFFSDPDKGAFEAAGLAFLVKVAHFTLVVLTAGGPSRPGDRPIIA
jgi:hypothetical protein